MRALLAACAAILIAGCTSTAPSLDATICDRGSTVDLFGGDPDCDAYVGDAAPPSTTVKVCEGTLPATSVLGHHDAPCPTFVISAQDAGAPDYLGHAADDTFRHVYRISGDPACVGTGKPLGSGRDCTVDSAPEGQCAYIAEGFAIYAVTGGSCSEHGVPLCGGLLCR